MFGATRTILVLGTANFCDQNGSISNITDWTYFSIGGQTSGEVPYAFCFRTYRNHINEVRQSRNVIPQTVLALRGSGGVAKEGAMDCSWLRPRRVRSQNISFYMVWWGSLSSRAGEMVLFFIFDGKTHMIWIIFLQKRCLVPPGCLPGASGCFSLDAWCLDAWMPWCLDAWMPGCLDARMPGCQDAWMPGCLDAWMSGCLKSMICWSKKLNFTFLNFLAIRLVPYWNLSHSLFNPHLSSLVPSKIVQVELEEHGF